LFYFNNHLIIIHQKNYFQLKKYY